MALNKNSNGDFEGGKFISLRLKTQDKDRKPINPVLSSQEKNEDTGEFVDGEDYTSVTGDIKWVEITEREFNGDKKKSAKILLTDNGEAYLLEIRFNILGRNIFNQLLGLDDPKAVQIGVYKNKKGYNASYVKQNGESVKWKFDYADIPKGVEINNPRTGARISTDFGDVDDFFVAELTGWIEELGLTRNSSGKNKSSPSVEGPAKEDLEEDDIPW